MLDNFMKIFTEISFIFFAISCFIFGLSLAFNVFLSKTIQKIKKESDNNYKILNSEQQQKVDEVIKTSKCEFLEYTKQNKERNIQINNNRFLKFFHLKQKPVKEVTISLKDLFSTMLKGVYSSLNEENSKKTYLTFTERDIFYILNTLKIRLVKLIDSSKIIWLKKLQISVIVYSFSLYNKAIKIKNRFLIALSFKILEFISWFARVLSPVSLGKYLLQNYSGESVSEIIASSFIEIIGKELAVIYKNLQEKNYSIENCDKNCSENK